ncbi:FAD/NAD(P)-binding protein [Candidatus Woesearchaeota archaeon]|nr:FAD/NAD(P)-binding protein [Candidatus Woesearchaeota archaeon]
MTNIYKPELLRIDKVFEETKDIKTIRVKDTSNPKPGQFYEVSVFGIGEAPFGSASYSPDFVDMTVRSVGSVSKAIINLSQGDKIGVRGPYGNGFPMDKFKGKDLVIVGGGTGVAPIRTVIEYVEKHRQDYGEVHLFFGFRSPEEFLFKYDYDRWKEKFNFTITIDKPYEGWSGNVGFLNSIIEQSGIKAENRIVIICGPPIMIKVTVQSLEKIGFTDEQVYVSLERMMQCGVGKCGHCMVGNKYVCKDGPVFCYKEVKGMVD